MQSFVDKTTLPYRLCVGCMMLNQEGEVFVAQRIDTKAEAWQMPQGGIDDGEEAEQALYRELLEEIGTNHIAILKRAPEWLYYDLPDELIGTMWKGKYRGQKQQWFLCRFLGLDSEINLATKHPEFHQWQWIKPQQLPDIIVPFKRKLYHDILKVFSGHLND